jgi:PAS domain S-box-containing protein
MGRRPGTAVRLGCCVDFKGEQVGPVERQSVPANEDGRFRLLVDAITDCAIFMLDLEGRVLSWNAGAELITGYRPDEIIGETFSRFYSEDDRNTGAPERGLAIAAREGRFESEGWRVRKGGELFRAHVIIDAIRNEGGEVIGFATMTRDITERRKAQLALEEAQQALFQAQKLESIGQLSSGIAHEFNNLLMVILGGLDLARRRLGEDNRAQTLLDNAMQAAQRGALLTRRMLAFARRQELKAEVIDLPDLVAGMRELLERSIGPSVAIRTAFTPALSPIRTDPNQLESAVLNLAVNARDAMPRGGTITISADEASIGPGHASELPSGRYVRLCVADTGVGMDEATVGRATEPFFTTKDVGRGAGLGLSMVHGLAEQSGGRLRLQSRPGEGTKVTLWLPAADAATEAPAAEDPGPPDQQRRLLVLAVDDDSLVLTSTAAMLEDLGHTVIEAGSGPAALTILQREPAVDILITDQAMPGMTGLELARAARALRPKLPVILATGYADLTSDAGLAAPRLAKPFTQPELAQAVNRAAAAPPHAGQRLTT